MRGPEPETDDAPPAHAADSTAEHALAALRSGLSADVADADLRPQVTRLLAASLQPGDHVIARRLLEKEVAALERAGRGATDTLYTLVAIVARYADPGDALLVWRTREATPETRAGLDVEQMARLGVSAARRALQAIIREGGAQGAEASRALEWLESGARSGAFDDLPAYFAWSDERFGLHVSGPT